MISTINLKQYNTFYFNHTFYDGEDQLRKLSDELSLSDLDWEIALGSFLKDWLSDDLDIELFTSGSTGVPKKIIVNKSAMVYSAQRTLNFFHLKKGAKALLCLSTDYIAGKMMVVRALVGGLHLIAHGVDSNPLKHLKEEIDFAALVPTQAKECFEHSQDQFKLVKTIILGGAKVDWELAQKMNQVSSECWETYGMTETVSHIALRRIALEPNTPFCLLPGIEIRQDDRSCLVIEPSDINQYRLVTNDIVELKSENEFVLKGRYDNVINTGGLKLFPEELEGKLSKKLDQDFIFCGIPDSKWGESVVLVIESNVSLKFDESIYSTLKKYEKPKNVYFLESFPRTESGKIQRSKIKEIILKRMDSTNA